MLPIGDDNPGKRGLPYMTILLVIINVLVYVYENSLPQRDLANFVMTWGMIPADIEHGTNLITLLTSMFVHGSLAHIGSNMLFLWIFADNIERRFSPALFLLFYLGSGVAASLAHILTNAGSTIPTVGASGAVSGVLGAYFLLYPYNRVRVIVSFFGYVHIRAYIFLGAWFLIQVTRGIGTLGVEDGTPASSVAFWAHVGGFITGLAFAFVIRPIKPERYRVPSRFAQWDEPYYRSAPPPPSWPPDEAP